MSIHSDNPEHGFQFPGHFELSAMGVAEDGFPQRVVDVLTGLGLVVDPDSVRVKPSSKGNYVSVSVTFLARAREDLDAAHATLRDTPGVKWTL